MKKIIAIFAALVALILTGCTTPETRIRDNPEAFQRATPAQQELIKQGKVALGFDEELVKLALGMPDRTRERVDTKGRSLIWSYVNYEGADGALLYRGWYHRGYGYYGGRGWGWPSYAYYVDFPDRREREHFRLVFEDGKVTSIESES